MTRPSGQPAPVIGLRAAHRVSGEKYLRGVASREFVIPAGARVTLRRLRPDSPDDDAATFAIVFAPPTDETTTAAAIDAAHRDAAWHRNDPRDGDEVHP